MPGIIPRGIRFSQKGLKGSTKKNSGISIIDFGLELEQISNLDAADAMMQRSRKSVYTFRIATKLVASGVMRVMLGCQGRNLWIHSMLQPFSDIKVASQHHSTLKKHIRT